MTPPSGGPITGPIMAGTVSQAKASTSSCLGAERTTSRRPTGVIIEPPTPCRKRAATKPQSESAMPQSTEPATKPASAMRNTRRAPKRSATQPDAGMNTASATR